MARASITSGARPTPRRAAALGLVLLALAPAAPALGQGTDPRPAPSPAETAEAGRLRELARDLQGPPSTFEVDPTQPDGGGAGGGGTAPQPTTAPDAPATPRAPAEWLQWLGIGLLVVLLAVVAFFVARRWTRGGDREEEPDAVAVETEAEALDRKAAAAESRGDHAAAVRLRFRAGVLRLRASEALGPRPATAQDVAAAVPVREAAGLVADLEAVAYGGRAGTAEASDAARAGWPVVDAAGRRGGAS